MKKFVILFFFPVMIFAQANPIGAGGLTRTPQAGGTNNNNGGTTNGIVTTNSASLSGGLNSKRVFNNGYSYGVLNYGSTSSINGRILQSPLRRTDEGTNITRQYLRLNFRGERTEPAQLATAQMTNSSGGKASSGGMGGGQAGTKSPAISGKMN